jgi:hypothetical protein
VLIESIIYNKDSLIITPTSRIIINLIIFNRDIFIKAKILYFNKIYFYKDINENKYLY